MSHNTSAERRALSSAEWEAVEPSHLPSLCNLGNEDLAALRQRVRSFRNKARDISRQQRRELRGKAAPRGATPAADDRGSRLKLSVLASALKRINKEDARRRLAARRAQAPLARKALQMKKQNAAAPRHPRSGRTAGAGMKPAADKSRAPSGALNEEGQRPVLERSRKVR